MPTPPIPNSAADTPAEEFPPVPDEDGPHDVPDDKVIEKTLPTVPVGEGIGEASA
jgi:hypothetical protein